MVGSINQRKGNLMSLQLRIDDWFLGFKTRAVYQRKTAGLGGKSFRSHMSKPLKAGTGLTNIKAAARKAPEVMIKIPKRLSKQSKGIQGVINHLDYVSRNGKLGLETQDGERILGKQAIRDLTSDWKKLGIPDNSKYREALNMVLSMPSGTPPQAVLNAARAFAAEQFEGHQYVFALHHESDNPSEPAHPHVHLCVLMRNELGQRINPRKNDLFEWRVRFAEKLREEGVDCAATRRQHRGKTQKSENSKLRAMRQRNAVSYVVKQQAQDLIKALAENKRPKHPFLQEALRTRGILVEQYGLIAKELYKAGYKTDAKIISNFAKEISQNGFETQAQKAFDRSQLAIKQPNHQSKRPSYDDGMER